MKLLKAVLAAAALSLCASSVLAQSQPYPTKPIRLIVPYPAGGGTDLIARLVSRRMADRLGQPIVIDNRAGGGGIVGTEAAAHAVPDGYTLLLGTFGTHVMLPNLRKVPYDPLTDFVPVGQITTGGLIIVSSLQSGISSIADLTAAAKSKPDGLSYATGGVGTAGHILGESLKYLTKSNVVHVAYKGTAGATNDLLGGHIPLMIGDIQVSVAHIKAGRVRAVALVGAERNECLPDLRTLKEQGVPLEIAYAWGMFAPAKTPRNVVELLNKELNAVLKMPETLHELRQQLCQEAAGGTSEQYREQLAKDIAYWGKMIRAANIQAE